MSLAIDVDKVRAVLLADGWHSVADESFTTDSYEYLWYGPGGSRDFTVQHGGGASGVCATGFSFLEDHRGDLVRVCGPLTALLAVRENAPTS